jgi:hypothetical protein
MLAAIKQANKLAGLTRNNEDAWGFDYASQKAEFESLLSGGRKLPF